MKYMISIYVEFFILFLDFAFGSYSGFSPKPPGGWGFFSVVWGSTSVKKTPPPGGFREFRERLLMVSREKRNK